MTDTRTPERRSGAGHTPHGSPLPAAPTPLEQFLALLQSQTELPHHTEQSTADLLAQARAVLPHLPAIVLTGAWDDWVGGPVDDALRAAFRVAKTSPLESDDDIRRWDAVGLLVGLALAPALRGASAVPGGVR